MLAWSELTTCLRVNLDFGRTLLITALYGTLKSSIRQTLTLQQQKQGKLNSEKKKKDAFNDSCVHLINLHNQNEDLGNWSCKVCRIFGEAAFK